MDLANKYFMRTSGEAQHQANGFYERTAFAVIDWLKHEDATKKVFGPPSDKQFMTALNTLMEAVSESVDHNETLHKNVLAVSNVIENSDLLAQVITGSIAISDALDTMAGLVRAIEYAQERERHESSNLTEFHPSWIERVGDWLNGSVRTY